MDRIKSELYAAIDSIEKELIEISLKVILLYIIIRSMIILRYQIRRLRLMNGYQTMLNATALLLKDRPIIFLQHSLLNTHPKGEKREMISQQLRFVQSMMLCLAWVMLAGTT